MLKASLAGPLNGSPHGDLLAALWALPAFGPWFDGSGGLGIQIWDESQNVRTSRMANGSTNRMARKRTCLGGPPIGHRRRWQRDGSGSHTLTAIRFHSYDSSYCKYDW